MIRSVLALAAFSLAWLLAPPADAQEATAAKVSVKPPAAKAKTLTPPATAKKGSSVGSGKVAASTANTPDDGDSIWVQEIDIDGDGDMDEADALWDDEDKVLYLYDELDLGCALTDGVASSALLVVVYGEGNSAKEPAGSGWWAAALDTGECAVEEADVYGCTFDAAGKATECDEVDAFVADDVVFDD